MSTSGRNEPAVGPYRSGANVALRDLGAVVQHEAVDLPAEDGPVSRGLLYRPVTAARGSGCT